MSQKLSVPHILHAVPATFRCPGGAVAVIKDGELYGQHAWGYADLDARIPLTPQTIFPICSISKQMVCLILTNLLQTEEGETFEHALFGYLHELLPQELIGNKDLTIEHLVGMRSGLRDYWALTVLWGATPGDRFSIYEDAPKALKRLGGFHFPPGTQMSYCNTNFMALGLAIERASGQSLGDLLDSLLFKPAEMKTAALRPDTARLPPPCVGYEGSEDTGYIPYQNRIEWAADAGIQASLEDMIAYEKFIDRNHSDTHSAYFRNAQQPHYIDGSNAYYGHGLGHGDVDGTKTVGHGGALPGFRLHRLYAAEKRLSVVVLLNSERDPEEVAKHVMKKVIAPSSEDQQDRFPDQVDIQLTGHYLDEEANLAIEVQQAAPGSLTVMYDGEVETLKMSDSNHAVSKAMNVSFEDGKLSVHRRRENRNFTARPIVKPDVDDHSQNASIYAGSYHSDEIDSTFHCTGSGGMLYACFDGYLGEGPAHLMRQLGEDVWYFACHRSLDASPPGNWTLVFHRSDDNKNIDSVTVGCWLARNIKFKKIEQV